MIHANAVHRSQQQAWTRTERGAFARFGACAPASVVHHKFQRASSSRTTGRGLRGSGRFLPLGWCYTSGREFSEADCLVKAGIERRVAARLLAQQSGAQSHLKGFSERHHHFRNSYPSAGSSDASTTSGKRFADEQKDGVRGEKND